MARTRVKQQFEQWRQELRHKHACSVIEWHVAWWHHVKSTPFMNSHKMKLLDKLLSEHLILKSKSIIYNWCKTRGFLYSIIGELGKRCVETSPVKYQFVRGNEVYVLTRSGTFYKLQDHHCDLHDIQQEKRMTKIRYLIIEPRPKPL